MTRVKILACMGMIAVLATTANLILPPRAAAAPLTPTLKLLYARALEYWGQEPTDCTSIDTELVAEGFPDQAFPPRLYPDPSLVGSEARATQPTLGVPQPCLLMLERPLGAVRQAGLACNIMFHEVGHLIGLGHNDDPTSVMYRGELIGAPFCKPLFYRSTFLIEARRRWTRHHIYCARFVPRLACWKRVRLLRATLRHWNGAFWDYLHKPL